MKSNTTPFHCKRPRFLLVALSIAVLGTPTSWARPALANMLPNGQAFSCVTCHLSMNSDGSFNDFGSAIDEIRRANGQGAFWDAVLASSDADGDGATNGEELADPDGDGTPISGAEVFNPGDGSSYPPAGIPEMFAYQARILDGGNLANGPQEVTFRLYDSLIDGTELFSENQTLHAIDGLVSGNIGETVDVVDTRASLSLCDVLDGQDEVYLELEVNGEILTPRERIVSVPYALNAKQFDGLGEGEFLRSNADDVYENGTLTIDESATLDVNGTLGVNGTLDLNGELNLLGPVIIGDAGPGDNVLYFDGGTDVAFRWIENGFGGDSYFAFSDNVVVDGIISAFGPNGDVRASGDFHVGTAVTSHDTIFFDDDSKFFQWEDAANQFRLSHDIEFDGDLLLASTLRMGDTAGDQSIYFFEDDSPTGEFLRWDDSVDRFALSDDLSVQNSLFISDDLNVQNSLFIGAANSDHSIYFHAKNSSAGEYLKWDASEDLFEVSDSLRIQGNVYDLRLISETQALPNTGNNLVVLALVDGDLHLRVFDENGHMEVDEHESELRGSSRDNFAEYLADLKALMNQIPFPDPTEWSAQRRKSIIDKATYCAWHSKEDDGGLYLDSGQIFFESKWGEYDAVRLESSPIYEGLILRGEFRAYAKEFLIDHPLDPENKLLAHTSMESPDRKNLYDGVIMLDENGSAWVELPTYFEALNMDFRYQLTAIGAALPNLHIASEIKNNRFQIGGGRPQIKVSWQVTGIRHDAWARDHPAKVEIDKQEYRRGTYQYPGGYENRQP